MVHKNTNIAPEQRDAAASNMQGLATDHPAIADIFMMFWQSNPDQTDAAAAEVLTKSPFNKDEAYTALIAKLTAIKESQHGK